MKNNIIVFVLALLFSCTKTHKINHAQESVTMEVLKQLAPDIDFSQKQLTLIVPYDGCITCFKEAAALIPEVLQKQGLVIMPNSHKRFVTNTLEDLGIARDLVIIDTLQLSIKRNLVEGNPKIFLTENNKVVFSETVEYPTLERIEKVIASN